MKNVGTAFLVLHCMILQGADPMVWMSNNVPMTLVNGFKSPDLNQKYYNPCDLSYKCTVCDQIVTNFSSFVKHKHASGECTSKFGNYCVDCQLENKKFIDMFIRNSDDALEHVKMYHADLVKVHCYLCGYMVEKELYKQHLDDFMRVSEKRIKKDKIVVSLLEDQRQAQQSVVNASDSVVVPTQSLIADGVLDVDTELDEDLHQTTTEQSISHSKQRRICLGKDMYRCGICKDIMKNSANAAYHLHTKCFPIEGVPCIDCQNDGNVAPLLKMYSDIVTHNNECHAIKPRWTCVICYASVSKEKFDAHFSNNSNSAIAPLFFDNSCIGKIVIGKSAKIPLEKILHKNLK